MKLRTLLLGAALASLGGCDDMVSQPKQSDYDAAPPVRPGHTVAFGTQPAAAPPVTQVLLEHGRERYGIYCAPCHAETGDGDGMIVQRGFPAPPSLHTGRLRAASPRHLYDVITEGYGVMYPFDDRVSPDDRWAIVAYLKALQRSQHADTTP